MNGEEEKKKMPPRPMLKKPTGNSGDLRSAALSAYNKIQDPWGHKNTNASTGLYTLEPKEIEAYSLDYSLRLVWEIIRNGEETTPCNISRENILKLRKLVLETVKECTEGLTASRTFTIPDPVIVEEREATKREAAIAEMKAKQERLQQLEEERKSREEKLQQAQTDTPSTQTTDAAPKRGRRRQKEIPDPIFNSAPPIEVSSPPPTTTQTTTNEEKTPSNEETIPLNEEKTLSSEEKTLLNEVTGQKSEKSGQKEKKKKSSNIKEDGTEKQKKKKDKLKKSSDSKEKKKRSATAPASNGADGDEKKKVSSSTSSEKRSKRHREKKSDSKRSKTKSSKKESADSSADKEKEKSLESEHPSSSSSSNTNSDTHSTPNHDSSALTHPSSSNEHSDLTSDSATGSTIKENPRNRRRAIGSGAPRGARPTYVRGGKVLEEEEPIPTISVTKSLVDVAQLNVILQERVKELFSDPSAISASQEDKKGFLDMYHLSLKGPRPSNEDEFVCLEHLNAYLGLPESADQYSYLAVYDGHSGKYTSLYARSQLHYDICLHEDFSSNLDKAIHETFISVDTSVNEVQARENFSCGSTALTVWVRNESELIVGNVGDCRGFVCRSGKPVEISNPHNPSREDEKERIKNCGGAVVWFGTWRVNGILAVSRSIGDYNLRSMVIADPEVLTIPIQSEDTFLVMASDGLWDGVSPEEAIDIVQKTTLDQGRDRVCKTLCDLGIERNTKDNVTVVVVFFDHHHKS